MGMDRGMRVDRWSICLRVNEGEDHHTCFAGSRHSRDMPYDNR